MALTTACIGWKHLNDWKRYASSTACGATPQPLAEETLDIFRLVGLEMPNIGLLSEALDLRPRANPPGDPSEPSMSLRSILEDVRRMEKENLAVDLLERLLQRKIKAQTQASVVQEKKYRDRYLQSGVTRRRVKILPKPVGRVYSTEFPLSNGFTSLTGTSDQSPACRVGEVWTVKVPL